MGALLVLAVAVAAVAAVLDVKKGEIPDWLTVPAFGVGVVANAALAFGSPKTMGIAAGSAILGGAVCAFLPFLLFRRGLMGGGDVKLFMALGALCHPAVGLDIEFTAFVAGSLLAPIKLAFDGRLRETFRRSGKLVANVFLPKKKRFELPAAELTWFRFGPAILVATMWVTWSHWGQP